MSNMGLKLANHLLETIYHKVQIFTSKISNRLNNIKLLMESYTNGFIKCIDREMKIFDGLVVSWIDPDDLRLVVLLRTTI